MVWVRPPLYDAKHMKEPTPSETSPKTILDLIRQVGDMATEEVRREMAAQSVLRDGMASTIEGSSPDCRRSNLALINPIPNDTTKPKVAFMSGAPMDSTDEIPEYTDEEMKAEIKKAAKEQHSASETQKSSGLPSHASRRERAAESVVRSGKAKTIEEARRMVDEAI